MEPQRWICVIDLFGVSDGGLMPNIVFICDQNWRGVFGVAPPNPPDLETPDRSDRGIWDA